MNKNISICAFIVTMLTTLWLEVLMIATPANARTVKNGFLYDKNERIALSISDKESKDDLIKIIFFASLVATGGIVWKISQSRKRSKYSFVPSKTQSNTALLDRLSPKLRRQLLRLVNDPKTANRLLMGVFKNNSHRSANWIAEKVIYDLRRGR